MRGLLNQTIGRRAIMLSVAAVTGLSPCVARAASANYTGATDNDWFTTTNWSTGAYPGTIAASGNTDVAYFSGTVSNPAVTLSSAALNLGGITFGATVAAPTTGVAAATNVSIGSNAGNGILLTSGGIIQNIAATPASAIITTYTVAAPLTLANASGTSTGNGAYTFNASGGSTSATQDSFLQITGAVAGSASTGLNTTLTLTGNNNIRGLTTSVVNAVTGVISDGINGGTLSLAFTTPTGNNSTLWLVSGTNTYSGGTTLTRAGSSTPTLRIANNAALGTGTVTFNGLANLQQAAGSSLSLANAVNFAANTGNIDTNGSAMSIAGNVMGAGTWTKTGAGTLTLSGSNTYSAATTVSAGALAGIGANAFGSTTGISLAGSTALSLLGDASTLFVKASDSTSYNVTTTASGATINVDQATVAGTSPKTMSIGAIGTGSTAATYQLNFTGANSTGLTAGTVTGAASTAAGTVTLSNTNATGITTLASYASANTTGGESLTVSGAGSTTITGTVGSTNAAASALSLNDTSSGVLTLNGANTCTGQTTVASGATVKIGNAAALGASNTLGLTTTTSSTAATVAVNAPVVVGQYVSGTGVAANTRVTAYTPATGAVTLSAAATASGSVAGTFTGSTTVSSGGTIDLNGQTIAEPFLAINGTGVGANGALVNSNTAASASVTSQIGSSGLNPGSFTVGGAGNIAVGTVTSPSNFTITKIGNGTLTMGGTADNAFAIGVANAGTLILNKSAAAAGIHSFNNLTVGGATVQYGPNVTSGTTSATSGGQVNSLTVNSGIVDLNGSSGNNATVVNLSGGGGIITNTNATASTLTVTGTASNTFSGTIQDGVGKVGLARNGSANTQILTLAGSNTYSGGTTITGGTIATTGTGSLGTGNVTLASGATLTLGNLISIGDGATLSFRTTSRINLNGVGSEAIANLFDLDTSTLIGPGTYTATDLNTFFGGSSFAGVGSFEVSAAPEPTTAALFALAGSAFLARRPRHANQRKERVVA